MKLDDTEKRIFLAAMAKEKEVCEKVDKCFRGEQDYTKTLVCICNRIKYKVIHSDLWKE